MEKQLEKAKSNANAILYVKDNMIVEEEPKKMILKKTLKSCHTGPESRSF
jgi:hypothetical protein